jgi:hypothetical protein
VSWVPSGFSDFHWSDEYNSGEAARRPPHFFKFVVSLLVVLLLAAISVIVLQDFRGSTAAPARPGATDPFEILRSPPERMESVAAKHSLRNAAVTEPRVRSKSTTCRQAQRFVGSVHPALAVHRPATRSLLCPKASASRDGLFLGTVSPPTKRFPVPHDFLLQGLVPDDVGQVLVLEGKKRQLVVGVTRNVFSVKRNHPVHLKRLLHDG